MAYELEPGVAARVHRSLDSLHAAIYFAPEADEEFAAIGLKPGRMTYFASRSAPMGPVAAGVTVATFYNFSPSLVARSIPSAWALASCDEILAARLRVVDRVLRRLLGDDVVRGPEVAEAGTLAREATVDLSLDGRPLYGGHAGLAWPDEPPVALWHAITLLREYRGDGHIAALLGHELTGLEALITHTVTGAGFTEPAAKATRGWSDDDWSTGIDRLRRRGLLDDDGLTAAGADLRARIEADTDRLGSAPWLRLGPERVARLTELGASLTKRAVAAGAFPQGVFARSRG
ncbi:MAG: SCO6745 family protein [Jatrophihabitans sp.]